MWDCRVFFLLTFHVLRFTFHEPQGRPFEHPGLFERQFHLKDFTGVLCINRVSRSLLGNTRPLYDKEESAAFAPPAFRGTGPFSLFPNMRPIFRRSASVTNW